MEYWKPSASFVRPFTPHLLSLMIYGFIAARLIPLTNLECRLLGRFSLFGIRATIRVWYSLLLSTILINPSSTKKKSFIIYVLQICWIFRKCVFKFSFFREQDLRTNIFEEEEYDLILGGFMKFWTWKIFRNKPMMLGNMSSPFYGVTSPRKIKIKWFFCCPRKVTKIRN